MIRTQLPCGHAWHWVENGNSICQTIFGSSLKANLIIGPSVKMWIQNGVRIPFKYLTKEKHCEKTKRESVSIR